MDYISYIPPSNYYIIEEQIEDVRKWAVFSINKIRVVTGHTSSVSSFPSCIDFIWDYFGARTLIVAPVKVETVLIE